MFTKKFVHLFKRMNNSRHTLLFTSYFATCMNSYADHNTLECLLELVEEFIQVAKSDVLFFIFLFCKTAVFIDSACEIREGIERPRYVQRWCRPSSPLGSSVTFQRAYQRPQTHRVAAM